MKLADQDVYDQVGHAAEVIGQAATEALTGAGVPHRLQQNGNMFSIFFTGAKDTGSAIVDYEGATKQDTDSFGVFFHAMLDAGCYLPPSAYEAWFVSSAHETSHLDATIAAASAVFSTMAGNGAAA